MAPNKLKVIEGQLGFRDIDEPPGATAVQPGETDQQARYRNTRAFRGWCSAFPAKEDPELNLVMLRRFADGNFTMPDDRQES